MSYGVYYNIGMFEEKGMEPPTNWRELRAVLRDFQDPEKHQWGIALPLATGEKEMIGDPASQPWSVLPQLGDLCNSLMENAQEYFLGKKDAKLRWPHLRIRNFFRGALPLPFLFS